MKIYYTGIDCGDGSTDVEFFDSPEAIELLEEHNPERYRGEGCSWFEVDGTITGITIRKLEDVKSEIDEESGYLD